MITTTLKMVNVYVLYVRAEIENVEELDLAPDSPIRFGVRNSSQPAPVCVDTPPWCHQQETVVTSTESQEFFRLTPAGQHQATRSRWITSVSDQWVIRLLGRDEFRNLVLADDAAFTAHADAPATNTYRGSNHGNDDAAFGTRNNNNFENNMVPRPLSSSDSRNEYVPFVAIACHGPVEPYCFNAEESIYTIIAKGGNRFDSVNLESGGNWSEYDESSNISVIVDGLEGKWVKYDPPRIIPSAAALGHHDAESRDERVL